MVVSTWQTPVIYTHTHNGKVKLHNLKKPHTHTHTCHSSHAIPSTLSSPHCSFTLPHTKNNQASSLDEG
eukprot:c13415_g1_i1 orf=48-254(+)